MNWAKPQSIDDLKALCLQADGGCVEGFVQLLGNARSSKRFTYYPGEAKPWEIHESISDSYAELTDKELMDHGIIALALQRGALFIETPSEVT